MKSTGEVMGFDADFGSAFAKAQTAAFGSLPTSGRVFVSMANRDKRTMIFPIKVLADRGFEILATQGTAEVLRRNGIKATVVRKHFEGEGPNGEPTTVQLILAGEIDLVINTPHGATSGGAARIDGYEIRTAAVLANIPCITTVQGLGAAVQGIEALRAGDIGVRSLQDWAAAHDGAVPLRCSTTWRPAPTPSARTTSASGRSGPAVRSPGTRWDVGRASRSSGWGCASPACSGWRPASTRTRSGSTRWRRSGSASSRSARSPAEPQPGNPRPRLFRLPADRAIVNRMGFNNDGAEVVAERLASRRRTGVVVGVNIGKTKVVPEDQAVDDYRQEHPAAGAARRLPGGQRELAEHPRAARPAGGGEAPAAAGRRTTGGDCCATDRHVPLLVKIAPDLSDDDVLAVADLVVAERLDGIVATNTTISRDGLRSTAAEVERAGAGGLSGAPLLHRSLEVLRLLRSRMGEEPTLIGVGGIATVGDAVERLAAGADLLQAYTAFVYQGPTWPGRMNRALARRTEPALSGKDAR